MPNITIALRILISAIMSSLIGIEREMHGRAAGLRTHILVCVGSTLFMITSIIVAESYSYIGQTDPSRIAAGVVTGIGFLGAGAIIRYGASIRGLTTAASIWAVAAIGLAVGAGLYEAAGITTAVVLTVLILSRFEQRVELKTYRRKLIIRVQKNYGTTSEDLKNIVKEYGGKIIEESIKECDGKEEVDIILNLLLSRSYHKDVISDIVSLPGIEKVEWE